MEFIIGKYRTTGGGRPQGLSKVGNVIPQHTEGYEITDIDPEGVGVSVFPRSIEVQTNDADGAKLLALWHGDLGLVVGDFVRCRKDPSSPILTIEGYGGGTEAKEGAGHPFDVLTVDLTDAGADYATLTDANTAAGVGDFVHLGPGEFAFANLTLKAATYRGHGKTATRLSSTYSTGDVLTLPDGCVLEDLWIDLAITSVTQRAGLKISTGATVILRNCQIIMQNDAGGLWGILNDAGGTLVMFDCDVTCLATGFSRGARVYQSNLYTYNCTFDATGTAGYATGGLPYSRDVEVGDATAVVELYDTQLVNGTLIREGDFGPANIVHSWAAEPPAQTNPIINGGFRHWQRGTSFPAVANGAYAADRFRYQKSGSMVHTVAQSTDVPTVAQAEQLPNYSLLVDCTTVDSSIGSNDQAGLVYVIEGFDWAPFAQQPFWLSFWVKATKTGVYCISLHNTFSPDRSFVAEYTVHVTNTWEYKEIYVLASPAAGTWDYGNGQGLNIRWVLAAGSFWQTTPWAWQTGHFYATSAQVNACDSTANDWRLWGVMMSKHRSPFLQPSHQAELARAERYFQKSYEIDTAPGTATTNGMTFMQTRTAIAASTAGFVFQSTRFLQRMRAAPTVVLYSPSTGTAGAIRNFTTAADRTGCTLGSAMDTGGQNITVSNASANAIALDDRLAWHWTADAEL